jgi:hypothetical protein
MLRQITHSKLPPDTPPKVSARELSRFKSEDIIRGTIIRKYPGGEVLVAAKGREFLAYSELRLMEGQKYDFQVKSTGPRIELKVLSGGILKPQALLRLWTSSRINRDKLANVLKELSIAFTPKNLTSETTLAFKNLSQLLPGFLYREPESNDASWLSRFVVESGLFWENRVARYLLGRKRGAWRTFLGKDMKGLLLLLDKNLNVERHDHQELEPLALKVQEALQLIEQDQFLNLLSMREDPGWFWFIPGLKERGFKKAEVYVIKKDKEKICFSMFLEFTHLGKMEVEVSLFESLIGINFHVEDKQTAAFLKENFSPLETALRKAGLVPGMIFCDIKEKRELDLPPFYKGKSQSQAIHLVI